MARAAKKKEKKQAAGPPAPSKRPPADTAGGECGPPPPKAPPVKSRPLAEDVEGADAAVPAGADEEEEDWDTQVRKGDEYMASRKAAAVAGYRKFIAELKAIGASEVILNDHPSYDLNCGVGACDAPEGATVPEAPNIGDGTGPDALWGNTAKFHCEAWREAGGLEAGVRMIVFANGIGDMVDAATGEAPEPGSIRSPGFE